MSAASARYGVPCSTCAAGADDPCRSLVTGQVTDTHVARLKAYWAGWPSGNGRPSELKENDG